MPSTQLGSSIAAAIGADAERRSSSRAAPPKATTSPSAASPSASAVAAIILSASPTEHKAVLDPLARLARHGYDVTLLDVEQHGSARAGWLDPQKVADALRDDTCFVSVMLANNEIGVIQPLAEIAAICKARGVLLHCDATQAVGKIPVDVSALGVDLMSFTAHKIYGPKGIGALYVRRRDPIVRLDAQILGGGQQDGRRSGTLNVPGIVGFATALELCLAELPANRNAWPVSRNTLASNLMTDLNEVRLCGPALDDSRFRRLAAALARQSRTYRSATSMVKRCCSRWAIWPSAAAPRVLQPILAPVTCCWRWAYSEGDARSSLRFRPRSIQHGG